MISTRFFQQRGFGLNGVASRSLGKPPAVFPGRVATDADLAIAVDRQQTTLASALNATAASMTLASVASIVPWCLLSIDDEIVQVTGAATGNTVPITRGFDGTTPATHLSGALVAGLIDAFHHNTLVSEVEAIQATLGANLSRVPASAFVVASVYDFPAQSPGGSLAPGTNQITIAPVPQGVDGTDANHYLYVSGGTGAPEAVRITGGTAVGGAPSGTLFITCANAHTGAWTLSSATAGIYEAIMGNGGGTGSRLAVWIPHGTHKIYAPIEIGGMNGLAIRGEGLGASVLDIAHPTNDLFVCSSELVNLDLGDFTVTSSTVTRTGGWVFHGNSAPAANGYLRRSRISGLEVTKQMNGLWIAQFELTAIAMCWLTSFVGAGIAIKAGQTTSGPTINQGSGLYISDTAIYGNDFTGTGNPVSLAYALWIEDVDAIDCNRVDVGACTVSNIFIFGNGRTSDNHCFNQLICDSSGTGPVFYVTGRGTTTMLIDGCWFANAGVVTGTNSANLKTDCQLTGVEIRNSHFAQARGNGLLISSPTHAALVLITGNLFTLNGAGSTADSIYLDVQLNGIGPFLSANMDIGNAGAGKSIATSATSNGVTVGDNFWQSGTNYGTPPTGEELHGLTAGIGGSAMTAGQVISTTTTVAGAAIGMTVVTTPQGGVGTGFVWQSYVSAANTVTTYLTCITAGTPGLSAYTLRLRF